MRYVSRITTAPGLLLLISFGAGTATVCDASNITYNFSFAGANTSLLNATSSGSGFFTVNYTNLGPLPPTALTGFAMTMTLTTNGPQSESSTFIYGLQNAAANPSIILEPVTPYPLPAQLDLVTTSLTGTDNAFGSVAVDLNMGPTGGSVQTSGFSTLGNTAGSAVWTSIVALPEPSNVGLVAVGGLLGLALLRNKRRKMIQSPINQLDAGFKS